MTEARLPFFLKKILLCAAAGTTRTVCAVLVVFLSTKYGLDVCFNTGRYFHRSTGHGTGHEVPDSTARTKCRRAYYFLGVILGVGCFSPPPPTDTPSPAWGWATVRRRRRQTRRRHRGGLLFAAAADRHAVAVGMGVGCCSTPPPTDTTSPSSGGVGCS